MFIAVDIMPKNIKITQKQYRKLLEASEDDFVYLTNSDTTPNDGLKNITANGKIDSETNAKPTTGDKVAKTTTPQYRYRFHGNVTPLPLREDGNQADDTGEIDAFDSPELNTNLIQLPQLVKERIKLLIDTIKKDNAMTPRKKAVALDVIGKALASPKTPASEEKKRNQIVRNGDFGTQQLKKNVANNID